MNKSKKCISDLYSIRTGFIISFIMNITDRIRSLERFGIKPGLDRISSMLEYLEHPEEAYKAVIVGGTNGKGSTCAMIDSILRNAGFRTGLYTSPHLVCMNERVAVNNTMISDGALDTIGEQLFSIIENHHGLSDITYFEFLTALALEYFKEQHIDIAVLEVGMGGRFDATNAVQPDVSTITNIAMDHQAYLGNTMEDIAREKAGIIRHGKPFVTTEINPSSIHVLETLCREKDGILFAIDRDFSFGGNELNMNFYGNHSTITDIKLPLKGRHQLYNASAAIQSVLLLEREGITVSANDIRNGILRTLWPGRFETTRHNPDVILDSAHNPAGIEALVQTVKNNYNDRHVTALFAVSKDKDWHTMLSMLSGIAKAFVLTSYEGERSADPHELKSSIKDIKTEIIPSSRNALKYAVDITPQDGVIIATGSIYLIGELKKEAGT